MCPPEEQLGFDFTQPASTPAIGPTGYDRWHAERRQALREASRKLGLPLGQQVEVLLRDGTLLKGELRPAEDNLWVDVRRDFGLLLRVDHCTFTAADIASCVRLD